MVAAGRTAATFREDLEHLVQTLGNSSALLRVEGRPVYYLYDSYRVSAQDWAALFDPQGASTVRGTPLDGGCVPWNIVCLRNALCRKVTVHVKASANRVYQGPSTVLCHLSRWPRKRAAFALHNVSVSRHQLAWQCCTSTSTSSWRQK
jgi:hypothetical protein